MALDFTFEIADDISPDDFANVVIQAAGVPTHPLEQVKQDVLQLSVGSMLVTVYVPDRLGVEIIKDAYGFVSRVGMVIRLDSIDTTFSVDALLTLAVGVLKRINGDAVLLLNGETPVFMRREGQVVLNSDYRTWHLENLPAAFEGIHPTIAALRGI